MNNTLLTEVSIKPSLEDNLFIFLSSIELEQLPLGLELGPLSLTLEAIDLELDEVALELSELSLEPLELDCETHPPPWSEFVLQDIDLRL